MSVPFAATTRLLAPISKPRGPQTVAEALRRNDLARRQIQRRNDKKRAKKEADSRKEHGQERTAQLKIGFAAVKEAQRVRREDYELGPLAPRRDVGDKADTYGMIDVRAIQSIDVPKRERVWVPFKAGDRVVLLEGRDKGKIGIIDDINEDAQTVVIRDLNQVDVAVPSWLQDAQNTSESTRAYPRSLPLTSLRLVFPLPHPDTGVQRDVIIENLRKELDWYDESTDTHHYKRVVPELGDYEIPWPPQEEPQYSDHEDDTLRIVSEDVTFEGQSLPLLGLPMPPGIIDELVNKHSKYSRRRLMDEEYLGKIQERERAGREKNLEMMVQMRTPLQELHALQAQRKKEAALQADAAVGAEEPECETYWEIREGKPWTKKLSYDAKKTWQQQWAEEKKKAVEEGRQAKRPPKNPKKEEPLDPAFLEQLGAMMEEKGLDGSKRVARRVALA